MNNTKLDSESANSFLSKEELKKLLTKKKDKIQSVLRKSGCSKSQKTYVLISVLKLFLYVEPL